MMRVHPLLFVVGIGVVLSIASCKQDKTGNAPDLAKPADLAGLPVDLAVGEDLSVPGDMTPPPDLLPPPCTSEVTSCAGLCGKVIDSCTGAVFQCGGCDGALVCDLDTHTCITPKIKCEDFAAQCGEIKNSCGKRLDCGQCASGKECDPDTKQCTDCQTVTCEDYGYECGKAWLGCGSPDNPSDLVDCGTCADGTVCNEAFHVCEPACTPPATTDEINAYCAQKKVDQGVECGYISDGCGGLVFCGDCGPGKKCGRRGVANRCEPDEVPVECQALGKNCGTLESKCDAQLIYCGDCPDGQVCNVNGVCGPPCQPKGCAELLAGAECGNFADDGCGGPLTCSCGANQLCGSDGKCAPILACDAYTTGEASKPCSNGSSPAFPKGDGTNLDCRCNGNLLCTNAKMVVGGSDSGTCCQDTGAKCAGTNGLGGPCTSVNTCTDQMSGCCTGNNKCDDRVSSASIDTCIPKCTYYDATGTVGKPCSTTGRAYFDGATCGCGGNLVCVGETAGAPGSCCQNTGGSCSGNNGLGGPCSVTNTCTNAVTQCCTGNNYCNMTPDPDVCAAKKTCGTYGANGASGNPCSRGPSSSFPDGSGTNLTCDCGTGFLCVTGSPGNYIVVPTDGTTGTCQATAQVDPNDGQTNCLVQGGYWNGSSCCFNSTCDAAQCGIKISNACTTGTNAAGQSPPAQISCRDCQCTDYLPRGAGNNCSTSTTNTLFPRRTDGGSSAFLTCGCVGSGLTCINTLSTGDASGNGVCCATGQKLQTGETCCTETATCTADSCNTSVASSCAGNPNIACNCTGGKSCNTMTNMCVTTKTCASYAGVALNASGSVDAGKKCSDFNFYDNGSGGAGDFACKCSTNGGYANQTCTGDGTSGAPAEGTCSCTPKAACTSCSDDGTSNGCGGAMDCCAADKVCVNNGGSPVKCCTPYNCSNLPPMAPYNQSGGYCGVVNDGCQAAFNCSCTGGDICDSGTHHCRPASTCASLGKTGAIGSMCNDTAYYDRGDGTKLACPCDTSGGKTSNVCTGDSAGAEGTCTCVPKTCTELGVGTWPDGCGNTKTCSG